MKNLFEKTMEMETSEIFERILRMQVETYGVYEVARLEGVIRDNGIRSVMDIGTGEGSFLMLLAQRLPDVRFVGIDLNDAFLRRASEMKERAALKNVHLVKAFFDGNYDSQRYDMILTRFTLQHATSPREFLEEVYKRLSDKGVFVAIDEYLFQTGIEDPLWSEFYDCWIRCFREAGCNHLLPVEANPWLKSIGFKGIENSIQLYSPVTIGSDNFRTLVTSMAALLHKVYPHAWRESFFSEFEAWLNRVVGTNEIDPFIPIAHIVARR